MGRNLRIVVLSLGGAAAVAVGLMVVIILSGLIVYGLGLALA
jgi:hypothetical protein